MTYKEALYVPENMVLCLSGAVEHEQVVAWAEQFFPMEKRPVARQMLAFDADLAPGQRVHLTTKRQNNLTWFVVCVRVPAEHPDYYAGKVLAAVLGGNMSSRMFQAVREDKGLAYYISTGVEGLFGCWDHVHSCWGECGQN